MKTKKRAVSIAKRGKKKEVENTEKKSKIAETKEDSLDMYKLKAKEKIDELLGGMDLSFENKKDVEDKISKEELGGIEWLSDQVDRLVKENADLKKEIEMLKSSGGEKELEKTVISFFRELQDYYWKFPSFKINEDAFISKMVVTFPFLKNYYKGIKK